MTFRTLLAASLPSFSRKKFGKAMRGAAILCHSSKKKQHLCQERLTMEYRFVRSVPHLAAMAREK
jgi:hypothetical protein